MSYYGSQAQVVDLQRTADDVAELVARKEHTYKGSWIKRGGVGAYMMMARKWDRIENFAKEHGYDIFAAIDGYDGKDEGPLQDITDLLGYLLLVKNDVDRQKRQPYGFASKATVPAQHPPRFNPLTDPPAGTMRGERTFSFEPEYGIAGEPLGETDTDLEEMSELEQVVRTALWNGRHRTTFTCRKENLDASWGIKFVVEYLQEWLDEKKETENHWVENIHGPGSAYRLSDAEMAEFKEKGTVHLKAINATYASFSQEDLLKEPVALDGGHLYKAGQEAARQLDEAVMDQLFGKPVLSKEEVSASANLILQARFKFQPLAAKEIADAIAKKIMDCFDIPREPPSCCDEPANIQVTFTDLPKPLTPSTSKLVPVFAKTVDDRPLDRHTAQALVDHLNSDQEVCPICNGGGEVRIKNTKLTKADGEGEFLVVECQVCGGNGVKPQWYDPSHPAMDPANPKYYVPGSTSDPTAESLPDLNLPKKDPCPACNADGSNQNVGKGQCNICNNQGWLTTQEMT